MPGWRDRLVELADDRAALVLTLLVLLLRPPENDVLRVATWTVAASPLIVPNWRERTTVWMVLFGLVCARLVADWPLSDNHIYLLAYWCLAIALSRSTALPSVTLAKSARWLVGFAFLFAVIWKAALAPEFRDGLFFRVTLMTDDRFAWVAQTVGGYSDEALEANRKALAPRPEGVEILNGPVLVVTPGFEHLALALTWGSLFLEGCLAVAFLWPIPASIDMARHVLLLSFCVLTYCLAPVAGFGWLLAVMGLAQCPRERTGFRLAYVGAFALIGLFGEADVPGSVLSMVHYP